MGPKEAAKKSRPFPDKVKARQPPKILNVVEAFASEG